MTEQQAARVIELLEGIYVALAPQEPSDECEHPEDERIDLSSFGDPHHWVCRICKFDNKEREALEAQGS